MRPLHRSLERRPLHKPPANQDRRLRRVSLAHRIKKRIVEMTDHPAASHRSPLTTSIGRQPLDARGDFLPIGFVRESLLQSPAAPFLFTNNSATPDPAGLISILVPAGSSTGAAK